MKKFLFILSLTASVIGYTPKDYSHLLGKTPGISKNLLEMHFKLYRGYVKNTNLLIEAIKKADPSSIAFGALKRRMGWEFDGIVLHELYFGNLGPKGGPSPLFRKEIASNFGSYEAWAKDFKATGLIRGIGWVVLYRDPIEGRLFNVWINEHDLSHLAGGKPILVMDVWEHAYITEYGLDRGSYIDAFFKNINWKAVDRRLSK